MILLHPDITAKCVKGKISNLKSAIPRNVQFTVHGLIGVPMVIALKHAAEEYRHRDGSVKNLSMAGGNVSDVHRGRGDVIYKNVLKHVNV